MEGKAGWLKMAEEGQKLAEETDAVEAKRRLSGRPVPTHDVSTEQANAGSRPRARSRPDGRSGQDRAGGHDTVANFATALNTSSCTLDGCEREARPSI